MNWCLPGHNATCEAAARQQAYGGGMSGEDLIDARYQPRRHDHVCFAFGDPAEFREAARSFLAEGLAAGYRVVAVARRPGEYESWCGDEAFGPAFANGQADVVMAGPADGDTAEVDPPARIAASRAATRQALDRGFKGLRVAADVTPLVGTRSALDTFVRWEYLIDRYIATSPLDGMCGYQRDAVSEADLAQLACLHPSGNTPATPFRLYTGADGTCVIAGYLDFSGLELLRSTLERTRLPETGQHLPVDVSRLEFVDHNSLLALEAAARAQSATVLLRSQAPYVRELVELLGLTAVRVEVAG
jgi:anti-anti-sigma regulatory factor